MTGTSTDACSGTKTYSLYNRDATNLRYDCSIWVEFGIHHSFDYGGLGSRLEGYGLLAQVNVHYTQGSMTEDSGRSEWASGLQLCIQVSFVLCSIGL